MPSHPPILRTDRLTLRPFTMDDVPAVEELAGAYEIALNTLTIPHPYPEGAAKEWIAGHESDFAENRIHHFAIDDGQLVGAIGLIMKKEGVAELGYWIGVPFWRRGYASEAATAVLQYGFERLSLERIFACYFTRNPASGRVMAKIGMQYEGTLRRDDRKWGVLLDLAYYGILREEWERMGGRMKAEG